MPPSLPVPLKAPRRAAPAVRLLMGVWAAALAAGCATQAPTTFLPGPALLPTPPGTIRHTVTAQETLWSIGQRYGVAPHDLMQLNGLSDPRQLAVGRTLLIPQHLPPPPPQAQASLPIPLYQTDRWSYIIVHHSATTFGNAKLLDRAHRKRGFSNGLGYHFVIDNGTNGRKDGQIEIGRRWTRQQDGAHCNSDGMNHRGIGICMVGNFSTQQISEAQLRSLAALIDQLRRFYGIPLHRILRHGAVTGANTECPGTRFPWTELKRRLSELDQAH